MGYHQPGVILLRGGGDIATGIALRLYRAGFRRLVILEKSRPLAIRRRVCFSEAVYEGYSIVEGVTAALANDALDITTLWEADCIPVLVDEGGIHITRLQPDILIDATLSKRESLLRVTQAPLVIGIGLGFRIGESVHCIVESNRGCNLGRVLHSGNAEVYTGLPNVDHPCSHERLLRAPQAGLFFTDLDIGDHANAGDVVGMVEQGQHVMPVRATISGMIRGLLRSNTPVLCGCKVGDIEPRDNIACYHVSDKALAIGGGVLEAILERFNRPCSVQHGIMRVL